MCPEQFEHLKKKTVEKIDERLSDPVKRDEGKLVSAAVD
jgi:hypothetical protein